MNKLLAFGFPEPKRQDANTDTNTFINVFPSDAHKVAGGCHHTLLLKTDGSVWATGRNEYGQLGDGSNTDRSSFVQIFSGGVKAVATGFSHSMVVLEADDTVWSVGYNYNGQLGDGTNIDRSAFTFVTRTKGDCFTETNSCSTEGASWMS